MTRSLENTIILFFCFFFIAVNSYFIYYGFPYLSAVPFVLLIGFWVFFAPEKLFYALVLFAPLSITFRRIVPGLDFDFWFPTEPILVFLLLMLILKSFKERFFQKELANHPVFWAIVFFLGWLAITIVTSEMPIVSFKYFLVRFWFIGVFFYLAFLLFRKNPNNINIFLWSYVIGLFIVATYAIAKQASVGLFDHKAAHGASAPFFIDHTSYGAALAFIIPILVAFAFNYRNSLWGRISWSLAVFFLIALILSYSRAGWLSLLIGVGVWILIQLKIRFKTIVITAFLAASVFLVFHEQILWRLERNTTDSSGDLTEHVQSMFNISSDASNLERINRWDAAISMFQERPVFGWGPGTYQFVYAPFQRSYNKTIISTNFGTGGNAHSEYLGLLSEAGIPAAFAFVIIILIMLYRGLRLVGRVDDRKIKNLLIALNVGLITYYIHGFLNNFLDMDKIAALFWGYMAIIVALEYRQIEEGKRIEIEGGAEDIT